MPDPARFSADDSATDVNLVRLIGLRADASRMRTRMERGITQLPGLAQTRLRGRGLDFDEMRPYAEGDDVRHIDWNVTARTGRPYTRLYREERERAVTVALDLRPPMFTGSERLKAVAAAEYAAALLWRVSANQDRAAVLAFDGVDTQASRPAARNRGVLEGLGVIETAFAAARRRTTAPGALDEVLATINRLSRNAGLILLMSDCSNPGPDFDQELGVAGRRQKLVVLRIADPLELNGLPAGSYAWKSNGRNSVSSLSAGAATLLRGELDRRNAELEARFAACGVPYLVVPAGTASADVWMLLAQHGIV